MLYDRCILYCYIKYVEILCTVGCMMQINLKIYFVKPEFLSLHLSIISDYLVYKNLVILFNTQILNILRVNDFLYRLLFTLSSKT